MTASKVMPPPLALYHQYLQMTLGQILLWQVSAAGHQPPVDVVVGDDLEQLVELGHTQALPFIGFKHRFALTGGQAIGAHELDIFNGEAVTASFLSWSRRRNLLAGKLLKRLKPTPLFFEQALLAVADQVLITRRWH